MLSCWGRGGGGIGGGFELWSVLLFKCPAPGKSFWVKKLQIPHSRSIIAGQKNSTNDQKSLLQADLTIKLNIKSPSYAPPPPNPTGT